jgi:hypothetical protein
MRSGRNWRGQTTGLSIQTPRRREIAPPIMVGRLSARVAVLAERVITTTKSRTKPIAMNGIELGGPL